MRIIAALLLLVAFASGQFAQHSISATMKSNDSSDALPFDVVVHPFHTLTVASNLEGVGYIMANLGPPQPAASTINPVWNIGFDAAIVSCVYFSGIALEESDFAVAVPPGLDFSLQLLVVPAMSMNLPQYAYASGPLYVP